MTQKTRFGSIGCGFPFRPGAARLLLTQKTRFGSIGCGSIASLLNGQTPSRWQSDIDAYWDEYGMRAPGKTVGNVGPVAV